MTVRTVQNVTPARATPCDSMRTLQFLFGFAVAAACSKSSPTAPTHPVNAAAPVAASSSTGASDTAPSKAVLAAYERVRAALAADDMSGVPPAARDLEASARDVKAASSASSHFSAIAEAAGKLAGAADIKVARASFGDVSQHLVAVLAADKSLAVGLHVFECPMAAGYKKWVQPTEDLANPYMGKRMLRCGGESSWE